MPIVRGPTPDRVRTFASMREAIVEASGGTATVVAARATDLTEVYRQGETKVVALDRVSAEFGRANKGRVD